MGLVRGEEAEAEHSHRAAGGERSDMREPKRR